MTETAFSTLKLHTDLLENLSSLGYEEMTPIQAQSLPPILAGKDVIAQGQTGSGKTAAFGLGLLEKLEVKRFRIQSLVLCPTRELADQVAKEIRRLARSVHNIKVLTLCGGMPFGPQIGSLEHGAHIIVGTPGRIEEHLAKKTLKLNDLNTLVLDEADRMLEMGFQSALDAIIEQMPEQRQTLLFSATFPEQIKSIAKRIMHDPVMVAVTSTHDDSSIEQHFYKVHDDEERMIALRLLLLQHRPESAVVFCNTKRETQEVADDLADDGFSVLALHGDLEQRDRDQTLVRFANKSASVLLATDVAARGLDIKSLPAVINYELPRDPEIYVHRIGRTGRAGETGIALSLFSESEQQRINAIEAYQNKPCICDVPVSLDRDPDFSLQSPMVSIQIDAGRKNKIRPGDLLGALTGDAGLTGSQIGKIDIFDLSSYVAVERSALRQALNYLANGKVKGRKIRGRKI